jgi:astacin (peptidase family M12A)
MNSLLTTVLALSAASCSNDDAIQTETTHSEKHVAYVATLSTEQQKLLLSTGNPFGNAQQKDDGQQPLHLQFNTLGIV